MVRMTTTKGQYTLPRDEYIIFIIKIAKGNCLFFTTRGFDGRWHGRRSDFNTVEADLLRKAQRKWTWTHLTFLPYPRTCYEQTRAEQQRWSFERWLCPFEQREQKVHTCHCYCYYLTSLFHLFISSFTDAPHASLFVIVYTYTYSTQSPSIALLSCLLRTLGIVIHLHAQYT